MNLRTKIRMKLDECEKIRDARTDGSYMEQDEAVIEALKELLA